MIYTSINVLRYINAMPLSPRAIYFVWFRTKQQPQPRDEDLKILAEEAMLALFRLFRAPGVVEYQLKTRICAGLPPNSPGCITVSVDARRVSFKVLLADTIR